MSSSLKFLLPRTFDHLKIAMTDRWGSTFTDLGVLSRVTISYLKCSFIFIIPLSNSQQYYFDSYFKIHGFLIFLFETVSQWYFDTNDYFLLKPNKNE